VTIFLVEPKWTKQGVPYHPLLSEFVIKRKLGQGSYGVVVLAELPDHPDRQYAIKSVVRRKGGIGSNSHHSWNERRQTLLHNEIKAFKAFQSPLTVQMFFLYEVRGYSGETLISTQCIPEPRQDLFLPGVRRRR